MPALRRPPPGPVRWLLGLPVCLYGVGLGWLLGGRFLLLEHTGRKTGATRRTVVEAVDRDRDSGTYYVVAGWGERSQWLRNVEAEPRIRVTVGRRTLAAIAERLSVDEGERVLAEYARQHRVVASAMFRIFGSDDVSRLARDLPVVALRRRDGSE